MSDQEAVQAAHQRIHRTLGSECIRDQVKAMGPGRHGDNVACVELDCAYAALDVDDPSMVEMPWRVQVAGDRVHPPVQTPPGDHPGCPGLLEPFPSGALACHAGCVVIDDNEGERP